MVCVFLVVIRQSFTLVNNIVMARILEKELLFEVFMVCVFLVVIRQSFTLVNNIVMARILEKELLVHAMKCSNGCKGLTVLHTCMLTFISMDAKD
jgi:hypothetical protein